MPSKQWLKDHGLLTTWLTNEELAQFAAACKKAGLTQSSVVRGAVLAMLSVNGEADHAS